MFNETITQIANGAVLAELEDKLTDLVAAVRARGRSGKLTLTLSIKPAAKSNVDAMLVEAAVRLSAPEPEVGISIFYSTNDNKLQRNDPRQQRLDLKVIDMSVPPTGELKEVG